MLFCQIYYHYHINLIIFILYNFIMFILTLCFIACKGKELKITKSRNVLLEAPENFIPLYIRGGTIIPTQKAANNTMFRYKISGDILEYLRCKIQIFNCNVLIFRRLCHP